MSLNSGKSSVGAIILTSIVSILITLGVVAIVLSYYGTTEVATEVSPFVDSARNRLVEGVIPPSERTEPETEADQIMDGVAINQGSSVLIYDGNTADAQLLGRGILVASNGYIITDAQIINASSSYSVAVPGTKDRFEASIEKIETNLALIKIPHTTTLVSTIGSNIPLVNDLVVAITGNEKMSIGTGIVTDVADNTIETNIYGTILPGSVLVAKSGFAVGISLSGNQKPNEPSFRLLTKSDFNRLMDSGDTQ